MVDGYIKEDGNGCTYVRTHILSLMKLQQKNEISVLKHTVRSFLSTNGNRGIGIGKVLEYWNTGILGLYLW